MTSPAEHPIPVPALSESAAPNAQQIRVELERILSSTAFKNSKRYAAVLRYVVEQTLAGKADHLKERTIGVDVFSREPDYDTATDHVVRSAMAEVRKRLAQYYQDTGEAADLHLELLPGSYVPQFRAIHHNINHHTSSDTPAPPLALAPPIKRRRLPPMWLMAASAAALAVAAILSFRALTINAESLFWRPVLSSSGQVLLCNGTIGGGNFFGTTNEPPLDLRELSVGDFHHIPSQTIHIADAIALAKFAAFLQTHNKRWRIVPQSEATYGDLRNGPAILIGLMNNAWTERLLGKLRYRAERTAPRKVVIRDTQNPTNEDWSMDYATPLLKITNDYAIVLRVFDPNTGQTVITAAGISVFGTEAAAEFLTDPSEYSILENVTPGTKKNVEIVLSTEVVRAKSGRPRVLAVHTW